MSAILIFEEVSKVIDYALTSYRHSTDTSSDVNNLTWDYTYYDGSQSADSIEVSDKNIKIHDINSNINYCIIEIRYYDASSSELDTQNASKEINSISANDTFNTLWKNNVNLADYGVITISLVHFEFYPEKPTS